MARNRNYLKLTQLCFNATAIAFTASAYANPNIESVTLKDNKVIITGKAFTNKVNPTPLLWWQADEGLSPSPVSRTAWSGDVKGSLTQDVVYPNSSNSLSFDHGSSGGAALGRIDFESKTLFMFRKLYEDFDVTKNVAHRVRGINLVGELKVGDELTGSTSGAKHTVSALNYISSANRYDIFFEHKSDNPSEFIKGEKITSNRSASLESSENSFKSFNYKTFRLWGEANNSYPVAQGIHGSYYNFNHEHTDKTFWSSGMTNKLYQLAGEWQTQQFSYRASDVDSYNGHFEFSIDKVNSVEDDARTVTTEKPTNYNQLYQSQVSNGAQKGSIVYYDQLYVDDTWHRVILCDQPIWNACTQWEIQIPESWNNDKVVAEFRMGSMNEEGDKYLYLFDKSGISNIDGFKIPRSAANHPPNFSVN